MRGKKKSKIVRNRLIIPDLFYEYMQKNHFYRRVFVIKKENDEPLLVVMPVDRFLALKYWKPQTTTDIYETSVYTTPTRKTPKLYITEEFKKFAGLEKEVMLLGLGDYFEIWNPRYLKEHLKKINSYESKKRKEQIEEIWGNFLKQQHDILQALAYQSLLDQ
ncbi:MAG: division/cell wall cluster transcriptional repressor MraZ [Candidatus Woesearchaeota archaeon]|nr:division/cell wall cluster transcriptional repressor MraZ [Candidatus Woesearchaeota archaeon]